MYWSLSFIKSSFKYLVILKCSFNFKSEALKILLKVSVGVCCVGFSVSGADEPFHWKGPSLLISVYFFLFYWSLSERESSHLLLYLPGSLAAGTLRAEWGTYDWSGVSLLLLCQFSSNSPFSTCHCHPHLYYMKPFWSNFDLLLGRVGSVAWLYGVQRRSRDAPFDSHIQGSVVEGGREY